MNPHRTCFPGLSLCPQFFPVKHYHFLSVDYAAKKYGSRRHDEAELAAGHHGGSGGWREQYAGWSFPLSPASELKHYSREYAWDLSSPRTRHYVEDAFAAR